MGTSIQIVVIYSHSLFRIYAVHHGNYYYRKMKMSRKVLKNWDRPFSHIFQFEAAPIQAKILEGGAKVPFQFKGLPWRNSELSEMLVQLFYEFASENARNAIIELQE
jgi:hypothetical protein